MELIWNGTPEERLELLAAVQRNCTCIIDERGARVSVCEAHTMLVQHQRVLNGHLFARRMAQRFICEEWLLTDRADMPGGQQVIPPLSPSNPVRSSGTRRVLKLENTIRQQSME